MCVLQLHSRCRFLGRSRFLSSLHSLILKRQEDFLPRTLSGLSERPTSWLCSLVPPLLRDQTGSGAPGCTGWLHSFSMGSSAVTVTAMALNAHTHALTHINSPYTHPPAHAHAHTHRHQGWQKLEPGGGGEGGGAHGDSPDRRHASRLVDEAEKPLWIVMVDWSLPFSCWAAHKSGRQKLK